MFKMYSCLSVSLCVGLMFCSVHSEPYDGLTAPESAESPKFDLDLEALFGSDETDKPFNDPFSSNEVFDSKLGAVLLELHRRRRHTSADQTGPSSAARFHPITSAERTMNHILDQINAGHVSMNSVTHWMHDLERFYKEGKITSADLTDFMNKMHASLADTQYESACCPFGK